MVHVIDQIQIRGFRGLDSVLTLDLHPDVNFIIGRNGTGKTSLINLINASLAGDESQLILSDFTEVKIKLRRKGSSTRPIITVKKEFDKDDEQLSIVYLIQAKSTDKASRFELTGDYYLSGEMRQQIFSKKYYSAMRRNMLVHPDDRSLVKTELDKLVARSWLSVHRVNWRDQDPEIRKFQSPVDLKLNEVSTKFGSYFSTLDKLSASETDRFQTAYFLSLISPPRIAAMAQDLGLIKPEFERDALQAMFSEFKLKQSAYGSKLESFLKRVERAKKEYHQHSAVSVPADIFLTATDTLRIHELVAEWNALLEKREEIYRPKSSFIKTINSLFYKKTMEISAGNQPQYFNPKGDEITSDNLSSGEKQMLILLGEALLQRQGRSIYLADEPELSLHIDWQEKLVPSLRSINPNVQILFATHSPDIVGAYGDQTFDLEKML